MKEYQPGDLDYMHQAAAATDRPSDDGADDNFRSDFDLDRSLPKTLQVLERISANFAWSWLGGDDLFADLDPQLWERSGQNPRHLLAEIDELRLLQKARDAAYLGRVNDFARQLEAYLDEPSSGNGVVTPQSPAAYFCAEFGVHNSLPIYSGGLGILAGDHLKSASDLNIPLVAVGLFYRFGYFKQKIGHDGMQEERYLDNLESEMALSPVLAEDGSRETVVVHIRGREVRAQAWLAQIGRIKLYLLDTHVPENDIVDRLITGHLYGGSTETRIVQEKVLGIGGVRLLRKLGISPSVFHLNEGHSAFLTLELAREYLSREPNASFVDAMADVRRQCVFTTHTPVAAGNDAFSPDELRDCFDANLIASLKLSEQEFFQLGRIDPDDHDEYFGMTPFAIRMSRSANGVSKKHGEVSRNIWRTMFPADTAESDVPITSVTNGVHPSTWIDPVFKTLFRDEIGPEWPVLLRDQTSWQKAVEGLSNERIWEARNVLKEFLVAFIRRRVRSTDTGSRETINEHRETKDLFSPDVLTIGFARRVAAYKRWNLLLSDRERLLRMVDDPERPVQFVFAGKAHPQDRVAKGILQELMSINHDSNWQRRAVFLEDYDQEIAKFLVRGVDVWMNVPRRPLEASGTSGMKAAMNGGLNFSILDGWWIEGYNGSNGFSIGGYDTVDDENATDDADAGALYSTLEERVIPAFYNKGASGLPDEWISMLKNAIGTLTPQFSSDRMVMEYLERIYNQPNEVTD